MASAGKCVNVVVVYCIDQNAPCLFIIACTYLVFPNVFCAKQNEGIYECCRCAALSSFLAQEMVAEWTAVAYSCHSCGSFNHCWSRTFPGFLFDRNCHRFSTAFDLWRPLLVSLA